MSVADDHGYGPYTAEDLHALRDEGKSSELVDGWLIELSPSTRHDFIAARLRRIIERAAEDGRAAVYVQAPMDISTPAGARRPDVGVIGGEAAATAREPVTLRETDVLTVSEPFAISFGLPVLADFS